MNLSFKERMAAECKLESKIAENWGYKLSSPLISSQKQSSSPNKIPSMNFNISSMSLYGPSNYLKNQDYKFHSQIKKNYTTTQTIELMEAKIRQYNYLLQHKHINNKNSDQTRKILNIQPKSQIQLLIEKINTIKIQLIQTKNMDQQIKINKEIGKLYRRFVQCIVQENKHNNQSKIKFNKNQKWLDIKQTDIKQTDKNNSNYLVISRWDEIKEKEKEKENSKYKVQQSDNNFENVKSERKEKQNLSKSQQKFLYESQFIGRSRRKKSINEVNTNKAKTLLKLKKIKMTKKNDTIDEIEQDNIKSLIENPYIKSSYIQNGKKIDLNIKQNRMALSIMKNKVQDWSLIEKSRQERIFHKFKQLQQKRQASKIRRQKKYKKSFDQLNEKDNSNFKGIKMEKYVANIVHDFNEHQNSNFQCDNLHLKYTQQQNAFASWLKRKNKKYVRSPGIKILQKYNNQKEAKKFLSGHVDSYAHKMTNPEEQEKENKSNKVKDMTKQLQNNQLTIDESLREMYQNQVTQEYYWMMCRNQKINLLLKGRR